MRRFYSEDAVLAYEDDFVVCKVHDPRRNRDFDAVLYRGRSCCAYLMHNYSGYHGSQPDLRIMEELGCSSAWAISIMNESYNVVELVDHISDSGRGLKIVKVYSRDERADSLSNDSLHTTENEDPDFYCKNYEKRIIYSGQHSYHSHHNQRHNAHLYETTDYQFGVEMEVEFEGEYERDEFADNTSNWFYCERDGSLNDYGVEIITIPLNPKDAKDHNLWESLTSSIANEAEASDNCGLHVHVSRTILGDGGEFNENLGKLLYLYHHHIEETNLNRKLYGRARTYNAHDGKTAQGNAAKRLGEKIFKYDSVKTRVQENMTSRSRDTRYFDINIQNSRTIEFRKGAGTIDPHRVIAIIEYCELLCLFAKKSSWEKLNYANFVAFIEKKAKGEQLRQIINQYK